MGRAGGAPPAGPVGAVAGGVLTAAATLYSARHRRRAEPQPLWGRILASALLMAVFGWLLGLVTGSLVTAIVSGVLLGALGLRPLKLALGIAVGVAVGLVVSD